MWSFQSDPLQSMSSAPDERCVAGVKFWYEASTSRLQAWNEPDARDTDDLDAPFLNLKRALGALESSVSDSPICSLMYGYLKGSLRYHDLLT